MHNERMIVGLLLEDGKKLSIKFLCWCVCVCVCACARAYMLHMSLQCFEYVVIIVVFVIDNNSLFRVLIM